MDLETSLADWYKFIVYCPHSPKSFIFDIDMQNNNTDTDFQTSTLSQLTALTGQPSTWDETDSPRANLGHLDQSHDRSNSEKCISIFPLKNIQLKAKFSCIIAHSNKWINNKKAEQFKAHKLEGMYCTSIWNDTSLSSAWTLFFQINDMLHMSITPKHKRICLEIPKNLYNLLNVNQLIHGRGRG